MIDIESEQLISLNEARRLPFLKRSNGNSTALCTVVRWAKHGILVGTERVVLETVKIGGAIRTSPSAVLRFVENLNRQPDEVSRPSSQRRREIAQAEQRLDAAGI